MPKKEEVGGTGYLRLLAMLIAGKQYEFLGSQIYIYPLRNEDFLCTLTVQNNAQEAGVLRIVFQGVRWILKVKASPLHRSREAVVCVWHRSDGCGC